MQEIAALDGALLVDKPAGWTSHDVVAKIRNHFRIPKVGHCGTLDPNATGLLIIVLGRGTKLSEKLMSSDKVYEGEAKFGETLAFVGPSGSGKSTLMKLLVGLYRPKEGRILYNGLDENSIDFDDLRKQIGFVTQDTQLFAGTIKENLLFVNPAATEADLLDSLEKASCIGLLSRAEKGIRCAD